MVEVCVLMFLDCHEMHQFYYYFTFLVLQQVEGVTWGVVKVGEIGEVSRAL